jgi:phosphate starvation-inducible PhoH-like protein
MGSRRTNNILMEDDLTPKQLKDDNKEFIKGTMHSSVKVIAKNDSQKELLRSIKANQITICSGKAGCGKTFVSLGYALKLLKNQNNYYQKIYLVKSVTPLKGEEVGFLKGDLKEKIDPYMASYYINMEKLITKMDMESLMFKDFIRPYPLTYLRGASLDNAIIIVDEAQNITMDNARTILTRIGENSKMILLGDSNQIDMRDKRNSCLYKLISLFKDTEEIGTIIMNDNDRNVRNPIIDMIEEKFDTLKVYKDGK